MEGEDQLPGVGVVEEVVEQRQRASDVDLAPVVLAHDLLRDGQSLHQFPEESDVQVVFRPLDRAVMQLLRRQALELVARRHVPRVPTFEPGGMNRSNHPTIRVAKSMTAGNWRTPWPSSG